MAFSRLWLSSLMWAFHTFLYSSSTLFLFRRLGVNFLAHAHPLHECSKCRNGVDQFHLYLASGLGRVQIRLQRRPSRNFNISRSQQIKSFLSHIHNPPSCMQTPFGDIRVMDSESSCTFCSYVACFNANIDSCLLRLELNCMLYLKVLIWLCGMSPQKLCLSSFAYSRSSRN